MAAPILTPRPLRIRFLATDDETLVLAEIARSRVPFTLGAGHYIVEGWHDTPNGRDSHELDVVLVPAPKPRGNLMGLSS